MTSSFWDNDAIIEQQPKQIAQTSSNSFWGDDAIVENNSQTQQNVSTPRINTQSETTPQVVSAPVDNSTNQGELSWDANGNIINPNATKLPLHKRLQNKAIALKFNAGQNAKLRSREQHPLLAGFVRGVGNIPLSVTKIANHLTGEKNVSNQQLQSEWDNIMDYTGEGGQKWANLAGEILPFAGVGVAEGLTNLGVKTMPRFAKFAAKHPFLSKAPALATEGAGFAGADYGIKKLQGVDTEGSLGDYLKFGSLGALGLGTGVAGAGATKNFISNRKIVKNAIKGMKDWIGNRPSISNILAMVNNFAGTKSSIPSVDEAQDIQMLLAKGETSPENLLNKEAIENIQNVSNMSNKDLEQLNYLTKNGIPLDEQAAERAMESSKQIAHDITKEKPWIDTLPKYTDEAQAYADGVSKPWDIDSLPHLTKEEALKGNVEAQQRSWNEKRRLEKEAKQHYKETDGFKFTDEPEVTEQKFEFLPEEQDTDVLRGSVNNNIDNIQQDAKNMHRSWREERRLKREAEKHRKETNNFEIVDTEPETLPEYKQTSENTISSEQPKNDLKSQTDINTPKQDKTLDTEPTEHVENDKTKLNNQEENIVEFDEEGLEALGKEMQDWLHPGKKNTGKLTKLEPSKAEGSNSSYLYEKRIKGEFGTNKLDKDNSLVDEYSEGKTLGMHEDNNDFGLEPTDTKSLRKEIDEWNEKDFNNKTKIQEEHLPDIEENKSQIDGITKRFLGVSGVYRISSDLNPKYSGKIVKKNIKLSNGDVIQRDSYVEKFKGIASRLRDNNNIVNIRKTIDALTSLQPSVEVRNALTHLYKQAPSNVQKYIEKQVRNKGLNYNLEKGIELKSKRQLAQEQKQVRTFIEDESMAGISGVQGSSPIMKSARKTEVNPNAKVKPYEGNSQAGNTSRDPNTWERLPEIKSSEKPETLEDRINKIVEEKQHKQSNKTDEAPDWIRRTFYDNIEDYSTSAGKDLSNTRFAKADRNNKHKVFDFADEVSDGKSEIRSAIEDYLDDVTFEFGDIKGHGEAILNARHFIINAKDSIQRQLTTARHEIHHFLSEKIAKACGIDSNEYKMLMQAQDINDRMFAFEKSDPKTIERWKYFDTLRHNDKINKTKNAQNYLATLDDTKYDALVKYNDLYCDYRATSIESEAANTRNGEWKFFGKDIADYGDILRLHTGRTGKVQQGNNAKIKSNVKQGKRKLSESEYSDSGNANGINSDVQRPNSTNDRLADRFEDTKQSFKDWLKENAIDKSKITPAVKREYEKIYEASIESEEIKIKDKILTREQAINRRKQVSGNDGLGIYLPASGIKNDTSIDLTFDYSAKAKNKIGLWGRKNTKQQVANKEKVLALHSDNIRTKWMHEVSSTVEKSKFAKPIKNGELPEQGYAPINKVFLNHALYGKKSMAWYETMMNGEDAIRKAYKDNKEVADYWVEIYNKYKGQDYQIPKAMYWQLFSGTGEKASEYTMRYGKDHPWRAAIKWGVALNNHFLNLFKRDVLTSTSFFVNNRVSNQILMAMSSDNPVEYFKSLINANKLNKDEVPAEIVQHSITELLDDFKARRQYTGDNDIDNILNLFSGNLIDTKKLSAFGKVKTAPANIFAGYNKIVQTISDKVMSFNQAFENFERKAVFAREVEKVRKDMIKATGQQMITQTEALKHINKTPELREAVIKSVEDTLGNYNTFSRVERDILRQLDPFVSWKRTIIRHLVNNVPKHPERYAMLAALYYDIKKTDEKYFKDYQWGIIPLPFVDKRSGEQLGLNLFAGSANPFEVPSFGHPVATLAGNAITGKKKVGDFSSKNYLHIREKAFKPGDESQDYWIDKKDNKYDSLPASVRAKSVGLGILRHALSTNNRFINAEKLIQGAKNYADYGVFEMPDKMYDDAFGGYRHGEKFKNGDKPVLYKKRLSNKISEGNRFAFNHYSDNLNLINWATGNKIAGIKQLNKEEKRKIKEKYSRQRQRMNNK